MACNITLGGLTRDCSTNAGGVKNVYIGDFGALTTTVTSGKITALALATGANKFKKYHFAPKSASVTSTPQFNDYGEYVGEQSVISLSFPKMQSASRAEVAAISLNDNAVVVEDNNGVLWFYGYDHPVYRTGGEAATGTERTNANAYAIELTDDANQLPYEIEGSAWTSALWE